jgi:hypothetical protein
VAGVLGLSDVSTEDTGAGSKLKTGNLKRSYKMAEKKKSAKKCGLGQVYDAKAKKCVSSKKKGESLIKWQMKEHKRKYGPKKPIPA